MRFKELLKNYWDWSCLDKICFASSTSAILFMLIFGIYAISTISYDGIVEKEKTLDQAQLCPCCYQNRMYFKDENENN